MFSFHMGAAIQGVLMALVLQVAVREVCPCGYCQAQLLDDAQTVVGPTSVVDLARLNV